MHIANVLTVVQFLLGPSLVCVNYSLSNWLDFVHDTASVATHAKFG